MLRSLGLEAVDPEVVFELQKKEGAGAFGRVFRACYRSDPLRLAALKVIPVALEAGQRGEDVESVRREIEFLRACDHPNVVAFYGAYYKDSALWVAMEHCGGGSVGDVSRSRRLSEPEIAAIMRGALRGLAYLHSKKKIHRDIKGGNILLTASGQVKIADFGVSAQLRDTMSRRGTFVGTPYWMSPEMIQDSDYDYKADIWSLGITALELADQKPPLFDEHPMRVLIQIPRNPPPQLATPSAWSPLFAQFLSFCLQKDPVERPTALECLDHAFVRGGDHHVERVFSAGGGDVDAGDGGADGAVGAVVVDEPGESVGGVADTSESVGGSVGSTERGGGAVNQQQWEAHVSIKDFGVVGEDDNDAIAEDIVHLAAANDSENDSDANEASGGSSSDGDDHSSADGDTSSSFPDVSFQFRQPPASVAMISGDDLLQLSVSESFELPIATARTCVPECGEVLRPTGTQPPPPKDDVPAVAAVASVARPSYSSSSTELKLLPTRSTSPRTRNVDSKPTDDSANARPHAIERHAALSSTGRVGLDDSKASDARSIVVPPVMIATVARPDLRRPPLKPQSVVTTTPKNLASVSASWQNPLCDIDASSSHPRLNGLLNSLQLSASLSSSSMRLFTQLLDDEEQTRRVGDTVTSQYATPLGTHDANTVDDRSKCASLRPVAAAAVTSPVKPTALSRHSLSASSAVGALMHSISSPFRVAHNVSVTFNAVDARFEGAPVSEEWAALHRQFGIPLSQMRCSSDERGVPALLHMLRRELLKRDGLSAKHIYRVSPEKTEVQAVKAAINSGSVDHARVSDPHVYASLIKQWFRELPTPLLATLTIDDMSAVVVTSGIGSGATTSPFADADAVMTRLPSQERVVFEWLLEHMLEVVDRSSVNKMTTQSIAVVLTPTLFSCESLSRTLSGTSHAANRVADFLSTLLEWKQAVRRTSRRSSSSATGGSVRRSLLLSVASSPGPVASLPAAGAAATSVAKAVETLTSSHDAPDRRSSGSSDPRRQCVQWFTDVDQPLDAALGQAVDNVWRELEAQGISSMEAALSAKRELSECFERYQHSVLEHVVCNSKRRDERVWAASTLERLASGADLQTLVVPGTLTHMRRWVSATLSADDFERLLRSERATKDTLERLHSQYPMGGGRASSAGAHKRQTLDIYATHDLFHQIADSRSVGMTEEGTTNNAPCGNQKEEEHRHTDADADSDLVLLEGAKEVAQLIADATDGTHLGEVAKTIARYSKREPAIGNVLAGLGNKALVTHLELDESKAQLLAVVESAVRLHRHLQRNDLGRARGSMCD